MLYTVYYKKRFFWKKIKVSGHRLEKELDRMDFYFPDETILSIGQWSHYDMKLGIDWVLAMKKQQQKQD
jgi:hypothetical protein